MATFSASGKRIGRPPKNPQAAALTPTKVASAASIAATKEAPKLTFEERIAQVNMKYEAAGRGRRMAAWNPRTEGPQLAQEGLQRIRDRARDSRNNDGISESANQKWTTTLVGVGITPRFSRIKNKTRRQELMDLFTLWSRQMDAECVNDYFAQTTVCVMTWLDAGECFARRRDRKASEFAVPFQVQLLDPEMVPFDLNVTDAKGFDKRLPEGNKIRCGIEFDNRGKRIAYWVYKEHPVDNVGLNIVGIGAEKLVRVAASQMVHVYQQKRVGELRGVPSLAPVLPGLRDLEDYRDAVRMRQKIANLFVAFIKKTLPAVNPNDPAFGALTGQVQQFIADTPIMPMKPGLLQELDDGQSVEFSNPPEAGTTYSDYIRTENLSTAAGTGMPYELLTGDIKDISDRTLRVVINEFRRYAEQRQWQVVIAKYCIPVVQWFAEAVFLSGQCTQAEYELLLLADHQPHGWAHIHPVQDPQGKLLEVAGGIRSRSSVIGERGDDRDNVDQERYDDQQSEIKLGLRPDPEDLAAQQAGGTDPTQQQDGGVQALMAAIEALQQSASRGAEAQAKALAAVTAAMAAMNEPEDDEDRDLRRANAQANLKLREGIVQALSDE